MGEIMEQLNPYAAPQVQKVHQAFDESVSPEEALGPKWKAVCDGARKSFLATAIGTYSVMFAGIAAVIEYLMRKNFLARFVLPTLALCLFIGWFLQMLGLNRMRKVSRDHVAKVLILIAFALFFVSYFCNFMSTYYTYQSEAKHRRIMDESNVFYQITKEEVAQADDRAGLWVLVALSVYTIYNVVLILGVRRLGTKLQNEQIRRYMLYSLLLLIGCGVLFPILSVLTIRDEVARKTSNVTIALAIISMIFLYLMQSFYGKGLKKIADYAKEPKAIN
jgi:drug/metabolite transporter (DMT)-like permease